MSRILYLGDPEGALALLDRGLTLCGLVHGRPGGRGRRRLLSRLGDLPRWQRLPDDLSPLLSLKPDLILSGFFPKLIPPELLALCPGLNVHPSDLPRWRGPDPCAWAIRAGDRESALCVHQLTEALDEGDILWREPFPIRPRESAGSLAERMERRGAELLAEVAERLLRGEELEPQPQEGEPLWAPILAPEKLEIDWERSAEELEAWVRAAAPHPGAFTGIGEELLIIFSARAVEPEQFQALPPGTLFIHEEQSHIRCAEGALRLGRLQLGRKHITGRILAELLL